MDRLPIHLILERANREEFHAEDESDRPAPRKTTIYPPAVFAYEVARLHCHFCAHDGCRYGRLFYSKRRDARFCSPECRKAATRRVTDKRPNCQHK